MDAIGWGLLVVLAAAANAVFLAAVAAANSRRWRPEDHVSMLDQPGHGQG